MHIEALFSSDSNEWYTPSPYVESARAVMGSIDLDPASNYFANETVQAGTYYSPDEGRDGLLLPWRADNIFLNPPYGRIAGKSSVEVWLDKLMHEYVAGTFQQAIVLVNASTEANWFDWLWNWPHCFTNHRIKFINHLGVQQKSPTHGNVFVFIGQRLYIDHDAVLRFFFEFSRWGHVEVPDDYRSNDRHRGWPGPEQAARALAELSRRREEQRSETAQALYQ